MRAKFSGKYRGVVTNNVDLLQTGRIRVQAPDVLGNNELTWAMPCMPCSVSKKVGSSLLILGSQLQKAVGHGGRANTKV